VAHVNAVPTGVAAPRARQAKRACGSSTGMWRGPHLYAHQQACGVQLHAYMHNVHVACRGACMHNHGKQGRRRSISS
jgi:hypothetical protein